MTAKLVLDKLEFKAKAWGYCEVLYKKKRQTPNRMYVITTV